MGLLDRLGLRKFSHRDFAEWMWTSLLLLFAEKASDEPHPRAIELDSRVAKLCDRSGRPPLVQAVDHWIDGCDFTILELMFRAPAWLHNHVKPLVNPRGLNLLVATLDDLGVLSVGKLFLHSSWKPEARTAAYQMLEVVWPFSKSEEMQQTRLIEITHKDIGAIRWELFVLRTWVLHQVVAHAFTDADEAPGDALTASVMKQVAGRVVKRDMPADLDGWISQRYEEYTGAVAPVVIDELEIVRLHTTVVGRQFAQILGTDSVEVRSIGTQAYAYAWDRLSGLAAAYRKSL